ncbi:hypothetical protein EXIGLDRAFT_827709 [Exidia glandulosa HHB12029]|uniref:Uncharacterized protein n=1 Tax=Exidia glandulosa HHB12029 TaxID=1314781 RepID=A0A165QKH2_EXIGL|nr:hypothetical protein EXIGLDRAFT_827709 [Exidia glandulosa HHB12029]
MPATMPQSASAKALAAFTLEVLRNEHLDATNVFRSSLASLEHRRRAREEADANPQPLSASAKALAAFTLEVLRNEHLDATNIFRSSLASLEHRRRAREEADANPQPLVAFSDPGPELTRSKAIRRAHRRD